MKLPNLKDNYKKLKKDSVTMQSSNLLLVCCLAISLYLNTQKDTVVISNANPACNKLEISPDHMGDDSHIRLGYYISTYLGNITPKNASFVSDAVMPFVDPNIYKQVEMLLALELKGIVDDQVIYKFQPELAFFEDGKTFVTGKTTRTGASGNKDSTVRTFEFEFHVNNYTTTLKFIDVYDELPHDKKWQKKHITEDDE
ncbi:TraE/TraK family type IV conjugative transfer system protein [Psychromonas aquimarina]|uniref:TraE/TraK family type IV conjugative transfer system protein n=1 Tax=Psychromonas aquimarina TaxID=444919 RepID=UPI00041B5BD7|nr:TraE/TraK family type IV conjugative transfer system protein [Psychromonas aquimarina]